MPFDPLALSDFRRLYRATAPSRPRRSASGSVPGLILGALLALAGCGPAPTGGDGTGGATQSAIDFPPDAPRLVLFVSIDQGGAREIGRYRELLGDGLDRLLDEGVRFTNTRHAHAATETAPGHATLATGRHPSGHGIIANHWIDPETGEEVYAVDDPEHDVSPRNLLVETLGDWLRSAAPGAKVFSASGKDRAAVLTAGHRANAAFWYDRETGHFVTSSYYAAEPGERPWVERFHAEHPPTEWFGTRWTPLPEVAAAAEEMGLESVDLGAMAPRQEFPHTLGRLSVAPNEAYYGDLYASPFVNDYLSRFAAALIDGEGLGADDTPDLLTVSFSALDTVGHWYGPDSPEFVDTLVRLDRSLGELLDHVDRTVGLDRTLVVLSADHGVLGAPEVLTALGEPARRVRDEEILCFQRLDGELDARLGEATWLRPGPFVEPAALEAHGVDRETVTSAAREILERCPGVVRVWTRDELLARREAEGAASGPDAATLFAHSFHPDRSPDLTIQLEEGYLPANLPLIATHGSPYAYDTDVPWVVRLPGVAPRAVARPVETVDVAPTTATLLGIPAPEGVDGADRSSLILGAPAE